MKNLLFLVHRIPYPPVKGDKIRSYHLLRYLARHYNVYLGAFVDNREDWEHVPRLRALCADGYFAALAPPRATLRAAAALLTGKALTPVYYRDGGLYRWAAGLLNGGRVSRVVAFSGAMAQYVVACGNANARKIIDFVDVDSDKWAQYSAVTPWPRNRVYAREARMLQRYERDTAQLFDACVFASPAEAELFRRRAPELVDRVTCISNGVDAEYFNPDRIYPNPYAPQQKVVVFTGAMDYWPNVDAVSWFAREIFVLVREKIAAARFYIVGARPLPAVLRLQRPDVVTVTGTVDDVRPYLAHADVAVAPLRITRGVQNKVLEAMAMGIPVVATPAALEGLVGRPAVAAAQTAPDFAARIVALLDGGRTVMTPTAVRDWAVRNYDWDRNLAPWLGLLEEEART